MESLNARLFGGIKRQAVYKSLTAGMLRGKTTAQNISNINTPGYKRQEVSFEKELRQALKMKSTGAKTDSKHMEISKKARMMKVNAYNHRPFDATNSSGVNNVDIDIENAKMAENQIFFNYGVRFSSFNKINGAIRGQMK